MYYRHCGSENTMPIFKHQIVRNLQINLTPAPKVNLCKPKKFRKKGRDRKQKAIGAEALFKH